MEKEKNTQKPLTLKQLAQYNQEVLFPALEERFVTKSEFSNLRGEFSNLRGEFNNLKKDFINFKDKSLTAQDQILKKLDILLVEKNSA